MAFLFFNFFFFLKGGVDMEGGLLGQDSRPIKSNYSTFCTNLEFCRAYMFDIHKHSSCQVCNITPSQNQNSIP